jgi:RNA-directed DNA polymerase
VNTDAPTESALYWAERRVLEIQTKLHKWAGDDPHHRFDDLFNLVYDPAFLLVAWDRVRGNTGARTAGVDGETAHYIEAERGVRGFLDDLRSSLRDRSFQPLPSRRRAIPKAGGKVLHRGHDPRPGSPSQCQTGAGADFRGGFSPVLLRFPPESQGT